MAPLQKQTVNINFAKGLDTKSDPFQIAPGSFLTLENSVFTKGGLLQKRNGFGPLTALDEFATFTTTFNGNLTAIGDAFQAYSQSSMTWINKGSLKPVELDTLALIRSNLNQSQSDVSVSSNGLVCTAYTDDLSTGSPQYKYAIASIETGQNIVAPTVITSSGGVVSGSPRVFQLGNYFVVVFGVLQSATYRLHYISISVVDPTQVTASAAISLSYTPHAPLAFDGVVANNNLYLVWNATDLGGAIRMTYLNSALGQANTVVFAGRVATNMSVCSDTSGSTPVIYAAFYDSVSQDGYALAVNQDLTTVLAPTQIINNEDVANITSVATDDICTFFYEINNEYSYDSIATNYIKTNTIEEDGTLAAATQVVRSVGLASKAFTFEEVNYFLGIYTSAYQPSYYLINASGKVVAKLAYQNGPGAYYTKGLPNAPVIDDTVYLPYLFKDLLQSVNKNTNVPSGSQTAGIYSQTGINLATITFTADNLNSVEIGNNLLFTGGFLGMYDGYLPVEQGFFLYPDSIEATWSETGGSIAAKPNGSTNTNAYYYQVTYEWTDNQGNAFRSAPSIPISVTTTGSGTSGSIDINIPTLRLTYKTANPVKIVIYRWSVAQQAYYQVTSISEPLLNDLSVDDVTFTDDSADATILGNNLLYTTGGVLENISMPAPSVLALFQSRVFMLDAEDKDLLLFSKQVIQGTPVEMSDLLSIYVAPTTGAQGSTGKTRAASAMDDKLVLFKRDAVYYINGSGPDSTGANGQFSEPVFITSTVGCSNQKSIVFMPQGLMFQSGKGIWLLGRDLSTNYIGAPAEEFTQDATVVSAVNVPGTNQVRFMLDSGITLMYDYYFNQWGTFTNIPAVSSTLYQSLHTYIDSLGRVFQETPGAYIDGSAPVNMKFKTGWLNLAGLQGLERAYFFYFLGSYISPHKLNISIAYDYAPSASQTMTITPDNYSAPWGSEQLWGSGELWGGQLPLEQWRVFFSQQKCQSFQIQLQEIYDTSIGPAPGAGLTLSGMALVVGAKKGYTTIRSNRSIG